MCIRERAKTGRLAEDEVARKAVDLARAASLVGAHSADAGAGERARHVGFYLICLLYTSRCV